MVSEAFLFVPFRIREKEDFDSIYSNEKDMYSRGWQSDRFKAEGGDPHIGMYHNHYLLKFVSEHVNSDDTRKRQCFHYLLRDSKREETILSDGERKYFCDGNSETFTFRDMHLYFFSTGIGILALRVEFDQPDARQIADVLYHLKKASDPSVCSGRTEDLTEKPEGQKKFSIQLSVLDLAKEITRDIPGADQWDFFFYADRSNDRCYTLALLEEEKEKDELTCREDLYFLRNAYSYGFDYMEDDRTNEREVFRTSADRIWGVTTESAACIAPDVSPRAADFTKTQFLQNFNTHYLFMFILTLHQKFELYHFLTSITTQMNENLKDMDDLEEYRQELYMFEKDFSFAVITEVPQYQLVYEKLREAFNLDKMYEDVHEPLRSLSELREKKQDEITNSALNTISILAIFSALVDSFDLLKECFVGDDDLMPLIARVPHLAAWIILLGDIAIILILFMRVWIPTRKVISQDKRKKKKLLRESSQQEKRKKR